MDKLSAALCAVFVAFALFAGGICSVFVLQVYWGVQSAGWTPTPAKVLAVEADASGGARYSLRYEYQMDGATHFGVETSFAGDEEEVKQLVVPLETGAMLTVYVDPSMPTRSVALPGTSFTAVFFALLGLFLTLIPASFALGMVLARKGGKRFERAVDAFVLLLLLFFTLLPAIAAALVARELYRGAVSGSWPQAAGTVLLSAGVDTRDADTSRRWAVLPGHRQLQLAYAYTAGERACVGSAYDALRDFPTAQRTAEILRGLPKGTAVAVRYNPESPCQSLLAPGVGAYGLLMLATTLAFTLLFGLPALRKLRGLLAATRARHRAPRVRNA